MSDNQFKAFILMLEYLAYNKKQHGHARYLWPLYNESPMQYAMAGKMCKVPRYIKEGQSQK